MLQQQILNRSVGSILRSLFSMHLWPEQQFIKKGFGTLQSPELMKLLDNSE